MCVISINVLLCLFRLKIKVRAQTIAEEILDRPVLSTNQQIKQQIPVDDVL